MLSVRMSYINGECSIPLLLSLFYIFVFWLFEGLQIDLEGTSTGLSLDEG